MSRGQILSGNIRGWILEGHLIPPMKRSNVVNTLEVSYIRQTWLTRLQKISQTGKPGIFFRLMRAKIVAARVFYNSVRASKKSARLENLEFCLDLNVRKMWLRVCFTIRCAQFQNLARGKIRSIVLHGRQMGNVKLSWDQALCSLSCFHEIAIHVIF